MFNVCFEAGFVLVARLSCIHNSNCAVYDSMDFHNPSSSFYHLGPPSTSFIILSSLWNDNFFVANYVFMIFLGFHVAPSYGVSRIISRQFQYLFIYIYIYISGIGSVLGLWSFQTLPFGWFLVPAIYFLCGWPQTKPESLLLLKSCLGTIMLLSLLCWTCLFCSTSIQYLRTAPDELFAQ